MGAEPYWYITAYDENLDLALQELRNREFQAGRYNPVRPSIDFPITANSPAPGRRHASIEQAFEAAGADGTRSILDIMAISETPEFCAACPLDDAMLKKLYGTTRPTRAAVESSSGRRFLEDVERGHAVYIVLYENDKPTEVLFAGYSFD